MHTASHRSLKAAGLALAAVLTCAAVAWAGPAPIVGKAAAGITLAQLEAAVRPIKIGSATVGGKLTDVTCDKSLKCSYRGADGATHEAQASKSAGGKPGGKVEIHIPTPLGPIVIIVTKNPSPSGPTDGGGGGGGSTDGGGTGGSSGGEGPVEAPQK